MWKFSSATTVPVESIQWPVSDGELEDNQPKLTKANMVATLSEEITEFNHAFTHCLSNQRNAQFPQTKFSKVDQIFKTSESRFSSNSEAKQLDNDI